MENMQKNNFTIPIAIIIAGAFIAGAIFLSSNNDSKNLVAENDQEQVVPQQEVNTLAAINPVTGEDHIRGNPNAPIKIVEYSDFECPFCKRFHTTMNQIMNEYGKNGQVAWVYRHFPLDQLHPVKARSEAVASECVTEFGGNDAFWQFTDRFFELTPSNNQTDLSVLGQIAEEIGLDIDTFNTCLESDKYDRHIQNDIDNAIATGGTGTPWSVVIAQNGRILPLSGAQPYRVVKQLIEIMLREK